MSIYDELKPVAQSLLKEFKQGTISLIQIIPASGPADNPGAPTEITRTLDATVTGAPFKYVRDGFATVSDMMVTAAVIDGVTITKNDFIVIDGIRCKIIEDVSVPASGTRVAWKFIVRK